MPSDTVPQAGYCLTTAQVAERLHVKEETVRRWARDGLIAHFLSPGGQRKFAEADVRKFLRERRVA